MLLTEIVLEGVKCFKQLRRIPLKPGFNLIYGLNESGKSTIHECLLILLDPLRNVGEEEDYPAWGPPGNSRVGIVLQEGQDSFRLMKDFVNGQVSLSRRNPQTQKYESLTADPSKIDSFLRQNLKLPPASSYRKLFCFDDKDMPSQRPKIVVKRVKVGGGDGAAMSPSFAMPSAPVAPPAGYGLTPEEKKRRIEELRTQRDKTKEIADLQFEIEGLENKRFEIENKIKGIISMEDQAEQVKRNLDKLSSFNDLPKDIVHRIEDFEGSQREQNKLVTAMDQKVAEAQAMHSQFAARMPFFKEKNFMIGVAAMVGGIVFAASGLTEKASILKAVPPLAIVAGVVLIFWIVWNELNARSGETESKEKLDKLMAELGEAEKKFEVESSVIKRMQKEAGVEDPKELQDKLKEYRILSEKFDDLKVKIEKDKKASGFTMLEKEANSYKERIEELNKKLRELGDSGFQRDAADIQKEIDALQYSIDHPSELPPPGMSYNPAPAAPAQAAFNPAPQMQSSGGMSDDFLGGSDDLAYAAGAAMLGGAPTANPSSGGDGTMISDSHPQAEESSENPVDSLWASAEAFSGMDRSTLIMQVKDRFNAYVQAFTNKAYSEGDLSSEKTLSLRTATGSYIDLEKLPPSSRDAAWLALKVAVIENICAKRSLPLLLDDPMKLFDDTRLANASRSLKGLGKVAQVVLLSTQKGHGKIADSAVSLMPAEKT